MINPSDPLAAFVIALLDDDEGINEKAYTHLMAMLIAQGEADLWAWLDRNADCADGRFFLPTKAVAKVAV
tara:strand:+ start:393 stop:602 length:210 start_codon:yes stop_codon:yes gene_type:complete